MLGNRNISKKFEIPWSTPAIEKFKDIVSYYEYSHIYFYRINFWFDQFITVQHKIPEPFKCAHLV